MGAIFQFGSVTIDMGREMFKKWKEAGGRGRDIELAGGTRIRALGPGATIDNIAFDPGEFHQVELAFTMLRRPDTVPCSKSVDLVQLSPVPGAKALQMDGGETFTVQVTKWDTVTHGVWREHIAGTGGFQPAVPNPTTGNSVVRFVLERAVPLRLSLHDVQGREIRVIAEGSHERGEHSLHVDLGDLPEGLYFYRLDLPGGSVTQPIVRVR